MQFYAVEIENFTTGVTISPSNAATNTKLVGVRLENTPTTGTGIINSALSQLTVIVAPQYVGLTTNLSDAASDTVMIHGDEMSPRLNVDFLRLGVGATANALIRSTVASEVVFRNAADSAFANIDFGEATIRNRTTYVGKALSALGTPSDGSVDYCNDCLRGSSPCTASSTGAIAKRENGVWSCGDGATIADPLEGVLSNAPRWIFKQVDFGDMTAGATADTFTLWTLPANTMIHDVVGTVVTGWSGGSISAAICSVGTNGGAANDLTLDDNFFAAATVYELHDASASGGKGALLYDATDKFAPYMAVAAATIEIQCDLTGDNHVKATAGQARISNLVSQPIANTATEAN